jgi:hypothetical protein
VLDNSLDRETRETVESWDEPWIEVRTYDFTEEQRRQFCPHPYLLNEILPEIEEEFFMHISDDDLPDINLMTTLNGFFRFNRDKDACYVPIRMVLQDGDEMEELERGVIPAACVIFGGKVDPLGFLDGNSVLIRTEKLLEMGRPWPEDWELADHADGSMLREFCKTNRIWPASTEPLLIHRVTELSAWRNAKVGMRRGTDPFIPPVSEVAVGS